MQQVLSLQRAINKEAPRLQAALELQDAVAAKKAADEAAAAAAAEAAEAAEE